MLLPTSNAYRANLDLIRAPSHWMGDLSMKFINHNPNLFRSKIRSFVYSNQIHPWIVRDTKQSKPGLFLVDNEFYN